jgi:hypothetical protein
MISQAKYPLSTEQMGFVQNPYFARPIHNFIAWKESATVGPNNYIIIANTVGYECSQRHSRIGQDYNHCYTPQEIEALSHHVLPYFGVTPDGSQITIYTRRGFLSFGSAHDTGVGIGYQRLI